MLHNTKLNGVLIRYSILHHFLVRAKTLDHQRARKLAAFDDHPKFCRLLRNFFRMKCSTQEQLRDHEQLEPTWAKYLTWSAKIGGCYYQLHLWC